MIELLVAALQGYVKVQKIAKKECVVVICVSVHGNLHCTINYFTDSKYKLTNWQNATEHIKVFKLSYTDGPHTVETVQKQVSETQSRIKTVCLSILNQNNSNAGSPSLYMRLSVWHCIWTWL